MKKILFVAILTLATGLSYGQSKKTTSKTKSESTSINISNSDYNYTLNASFDIEKYDKVKAVIVKALGKVTGNKEGESIWQLNDTYIISLKAEKSSIKLDKEKASESLYKSISKLGENIQEALNHSTKKD